MDIGNRTLQKGDQQVPWNGDPRQPRAWGMARFAIMIGSKNRLVIQPAGERRAWASSPFGCRFLSLPNR